MIAPERPRTGLRALKSRVAVRGLAVLDKRTVAAQHLLAFRRELLEDLGGEAAASAAQLALVDIATRTRLYLDHVDAHLLERQTLVTRRNRLLPLVEQRTRLAESLVGVLARLGLERRRRPPQSLEEYVRERYGSNDGERPDETPHDTVQDDPRPQGEPQDPTTVGPGAAAQSLTQ